MIEDDDKVLPEAEVEEAVAELPEEPEAVSEPDEPKGPIDPQGPLAALTLDAQDMTSEQHEAFDKVQIKAFHALDQALSERGLGGAQANLILADDELFPVTIYLTWALITGELNKPEPFAYQDPDSQDANEDSDGAFWNAVEAAFEAMLQMPPIA